MSSLDYPVNALFMGVYLFSTPEAKPWSVVLKQGDFAPLCAIRIKWVSGARDMAPNVSSARLRTPRLEQVSQTVMSRQPTGILFKSESS
jgi:hypothetical protein